MKKLLLVLLGMSLVFAACGGDEKKDLKLEDGVYYVSGEVAPNGWQPYLEFTVKDGKVTEADYDAYNMYDGDSRTKSQRGLDGDYVLAGEGKSIAEQLELIEKFIVDGNDITEVKFDADGKTDAVSGATISFDSAKTLFEQALKDGPVGTAGSLEDGFYFGQAEVDDKGNTDQVTYIVYNGTIVSADFNSAVPQEDDKVSYKSVLSKNGEYNLADSAVAPMHEQLATLNAELVKNDAFSVELNDEGKTDAISGATVSVDGYVAAFENAVKK